jgi:tRNA(Ile)-lysidine synthase TilS/MesJ
LAETLPREGARLSELAPLRELPSELRQALQAAEQRLYEESAHPLLSLSRDELRTAAEQAGLEECTTELHDIYSRRRIRPEDIDRWLSAGERELTLGDCLRAVVQDAPPEGYAEPEELLRQLAEELKSRTHAQELQWRSRICLLSARRSGAAPQTSAQ